MKRSISVSLGVVCILQLGICVSAGRADDSKQVFDVDCVSFAGRFLGSAPVKKKTHPGLQVDGSIWSLSPETNEVSISQVFPDEAAAKNSVEVGDKVVSVNGYALTGMKLRDIFCAYHMFDPRSLTETLVIQKQDGSQKTLKLPLVALDKCNPAERQGWLEIYKALGY